MRAMQPGVHLKKKKNTLTPTKLWCQTGAKTIVWKQIVLFHIDHRYFEIIWDTRLISHTAKVCPSLSMQICMWGLRTNVFIFKQPKPHIQKNNTYIHQLVPVFESDWLGSLLGAQPKDFKDF